MMVGEIFEAKYNTILEVLGWPSQSPTENLLNVKTFRVSLRCFVKRKCSELNKKNLQQEEIQRFSE